MKILNICELLPLEGLKAENDVAIKIQQEIEKVDPNIEFVFLKCLPYSNTFLAKIKPIWKNYLGYIHKKELDVSGFRALTYPWLRFPTSNFYVDKLLLMINKFYFLRRVEAMVSSEITTYDLILSQKNNADGVVASYLSQKYNIPHIHVLRGQPDEHIYNARYIKNILSHASGLITPSPSIAKLFSNREESVQLLPHGVDQDFFYFGEKDLSKPRLIVVARLLPLKNINLVIDSLYKAKQRGIDFEFSIVGEGPEKANLEKQVNDYNLQSEIHFLGWLAKEDVIKKMHEANIMIMPSKPETLGRVFIESAAAKCLCVGHEGTGVDGLFNDGIEAIFCDKDTLEEKLLNLLGNFNSTKNVCIVENAFSLVEKLMWHSVATKYVRFFNSAVGASKLSEES